MQKENQYSEIGHKFINVVKDINFKEETKFMPILNVLDNIKIKDGYILDFYKTDEWEYHTLPYVRKKEGERKSTGIGLFLSCPDSEEQRVFQYLEIPFTEMGIWQGYLLHILPGITPKGGHANYGATEEVYGFDDFFMNLLKTQGYNQAENNQKIKDRIDEFTSKVTIDNPQQEELVLLLNTLGIDTFLPKVVINSPNTATIESLFFSNFGGLIYESTTAIREGNTLRFQHKEQKVLVKYDCGIRF